MVWRGVVDPTVFSFSAMITPVSVVLFTGSGTPLVIVVACLWLPVGVRLVLVIKPTR